MIVIVDYGMGNLRSIIIKLQRMEIEAMVSSRFEDIQKADKLILPGVGSFASAMENLRTYGLIGALNEAVIQNKIPILGICLGMQLFTKWSEEGNAPGLGWINAETRRFNFEPGSNGLKVPHMGWNTIKVQKSSPLFEDVPLDSRFYFVHSYHVCCGDHGDILATTNYGYDFCSMVQKDNIVGVQFHPEKSHYIGVRLLRNFAR